MVDLGLREGLTDGAVRAITEGTHGDPFALLGPHRVSGARTVIRTFKPNARAIALISSDGRKLSDFQHVEGGLWVAFAQGDPGLYRLRVEWPNGSHEAEDPYSFGPLLGEMDVYLLAEGQHRQLTDAPGASIITLLTPAPASQ